MIGREMLLLGGALSAAALAALLGSVGLVTAPPPGAMRGLVAAAALAAVGSTLAGVAIRRARRPFRRLAFAGGVISAAALAAFVVGFFWLPEGPVPVLHRAAPRSGPAPQLDRVRIVSFNVLHGYPDFPDHEGRYRRLAAALRELEPTVVVLQEAWSVVGHGALAERLAADLGFDAAYARANGSRRLLGFEAGSAVLSRLPLLEARRQRLAPRRPLTEARIALAASFEIGADTWTVVSVHLATVPRVATAQAADLARRLPEGNLLAVAGDLNAGSDSAAVRALIERGLVDVLPGGIDHIFVAAGSPWQVERAAWTLRPSDLARLIGEETAISDHPGIVVDLVRRDG